MSTLLDRYYEQHGEKERNVQGEEEKSWKQEEEKILPC